MGRVAQARRARTTPTILGARRHKGSGRGGVFPKGSIVQRYVGVWCQQLTSHGVDNDTAVFFGRDWHR